VTIDIGTGDGRAVLARGSLEARTLAIGIDANAAAMRESSQRAARRAAKSGLPNVLFLVAAAESLPRELGGLAAEVTVAFPWGSLLRGCLGRDPAVAGAIASLVAPDGELELLLAPSQRDGLPDLPTEHRDVVAAVTASFAPLGLAVVDARSATDRDLLSSHSTWAKRLTRGGAAAAAGRGITLIRLRSSAS
jgi:16S rRNA (adenine(1408)-N(1))-methyltransferase